MRFILGLKDTWPLQQKWVWNNQSDEVKNCFICCRQVRNSGLWEAWKLAWSSIWVQLLSDNHFSDGWCDCMVQNAFLWCGSLSEVPNLFTLSCSSLVRIKDSQSLSGKRSVGSMFSQQCMWRAWAVLMSAVTICAGAGHRTWCCTSESLLQQQKPGGLPSSSCLCN